MPSINLATKVKIICTMGPAVASTSKIISLVKAGANAFRLNMSHGNYTTHQHFIDVIRAADEKLGIYLPIIADLQGPKIRVGDLGERDHLVLITGQQVKLADVAVMKREKFAITDTMIPVQYPTLGKDVRKGDVLLLDDGLMKLQVTNVSHDVVTCIIVHGGKLKPRKGINLPQTKVSQPSMTSKDRADVRFAIEQNVDYIALSFVRKAADVEAVRRYIAKYGGAQHVIAKIEKPEALQNIDDIIDASDAIMVARGDLGVEIPAETVPIVQKRIIKLCNDHGRPVITATQMLESMIHNPRPTRAEASDVANAVLDGTDGVMLSAETSVGAYPVEAVHYMRQICMQTEAQLSEDGAINLPGARHAKISARNTGSIATAAAHIAEEDRVGAIASLSYSGETARLLSNRRPRAPILAITTVPAVARRMNLLWGVSSIVVDTISSTDDTIEDIKTRLVREKILPVGSTVVFTIGRPLVGRARTNMISIETL